MQEYWSRRRREALASSRRPSNAEVRSIHLRMAEHYRSLEQWCSAIPGQCAGAAAPEGADHG
ncbi:hypothetical protein [Sphingomonas segetis]|jgi:hypothetical protein|uniref:hypothetical protein n=1 Tax=Sphingomonas segetis TaxID=1104779 RepID=UPI0012D351C5|nr:hypothetical protein [Sphingomonas segetis]